MAAVHAFLVVSDLPASCCTRSYNSDHQYGSHSLSSNTIALVASTEAAKHTSLHASLFHMLVHACCWWGRRGMSTCTGWLTGYHLRCVCFFNAVLVVLMDVAVFRRYPAASMALDCRIPKHTARCPVNQKLSSSRCCCWCHHSWASRYSPGSLSTRSSCVDRRPANTLVVHNAAFDAGVLHARATDG